MISQQKLYIERRKLREQLNTIDKLIYGSAELATAAQIADIACRVDENRVNFTYGHEIASRLHDLAAMAAGDKVKEIYNDD